MTLTVGPAIDSLVTKATTATSGVTVNGQPVSVVDGWPHELTDGMFVIGIDQAPPDPAGDVTVSRTWEGLGAQHVLEDFGIPCYIDIRVPGTTTQKTPRDIAETVFNNFWQQIKTDLTLSGILQAGRVATIDTVTETPSNVGTVADPGRRHVIAFHVRCENLTS